jgi:hypothetical protein
MPRNPMNAKADSGISSVGSSPGLAKPKDRAMPQQRYRTPFFLRLPPIDRRSGRRAGAGRARRPEDAA